MLLRLMLFALAILPSLAAGAQHLESVKLADRMARLHVPGVSVAVIHEGKLDWASGFGTATADTLFQAGSISKPVTAMAVMRLVEAGKLDLDADVNRYLKSWKIPDSSLTGETKVTLRGLLSHTAGININGFGGYPANAPVPSLLRILNGEKPAITGPIHVEAAPGSAWSYSGGGYVIVQQLLEDVTGRPFPELVRELVLSPIGMQHSTFQQPVPERAATPYLGDGEPLRGGPRVYPEMAAAGLWTTASDLALFAMEVQRAFAGEAGRTISEASARVMLTPIRNRWGLGFEVGGSTQHPYFTHQGANAGFQSVFVAYTSGDGAAVMTNGDNGAGIAGRILNAIAADDGWPDFPPVRIDPRFEEQTPDPRSEALLRRMIDTVRAGQPNYDEQSPSLAETTRQRLGALKGAMTRLGAIQAVTFKNVDDVGGDLYRVRFENGTWECRIAVGLGGKIESFGMRQE